MPIAIQGAVIISQENDGRFKYNKKCEKCGDIQTSTSSATGGHHGSWSTSFKCHKCGNMQKVVVKRN